MSFCRFPAPPASLLLIRVLQRCAAFCSDAWKLKYKNYGDASCCLFKIHSDNTVEAFPAQGRQGLYQYADREKIALGGSSNTQQALSLDAYLRNGTSYRTTTFNNPTLLSSSQFHIARVEVFHFYNPADGLSPLHPYSTLTLSFLTSVLSMATDEKYVANDKKAKSVLEMNDMFLLDILGKSVSADVRDR